MASSYTRVVRSLILVILTGGVSPPPDTPTLSARAFVVGSGVRRRPGRSSAPMTNARSDDERPIRRRTPEPTAWVGLGGLRPPSSTVYGYFVYGYRKTPLIDDYVIVLFRLFVRIVRFVCSPACPSVRFFVHSLVRSFVRRNERTNERTSERTNERSKRPSVICK